MSSRRSRRSPLARHFLLSYAIAYAVLIGAMGWFVFLSVEAALTERLLDELEGDARLAKAGMPSNREALTLWVEEVSQASGLRFTVISTDGLVVADSHSDPGDMESHAGRPEVAAAQAGQVGRSTRRSETTGFEQHYVALPSEDDLILRVSESERDIAEIMDRLRRSVVTIAVVVGIIGVAIVAWLARRLTAPIEGLTSKTLALTDGEGGRGLPRSSVSELDQLGVAIEQLEEESRARLLEAERATATIETVLGALPQGTILFDENDNVAYANPSARELLGAVPSSLLDLVPFPFQTVVRECREDLVPSVQEVEHGTPIRRLRGAATLFADDGRVLLVIEDVTESHRVAAVRRDFVADASHELKTPVASIIASSEALQIAVEQGDGSQARFARQIEESARQLDRLVADLLDLSRIERDRPELKSLGLHLLLSEELERIRPVAEERQIGLTVATDPVRVAGSRRDVAIAIRNLLDNALRYTRPGGSIGVELTAFDGDAVLRIVDTGEGIPSRDLDRLFERFYRVDNARARATGGTGLGLAIVKHIVESHGGTVEVVSELGVGSTFTIRLPVLDEDTTDGPLA